MPITSRSSESAWFLCFALLVTSIIAGCNTVPKGALALKKDTLENRILQTRRYDTLAEKRLLSASAAVMQDMGFALDESETSLGVLVGSKTRSAIDEVQVAAAIVVIAMGGTNVAIDERQLIRMSIVTRPSKTERASLVRVTFQRTIWNTHKVVSRIEAINDPEIYAEFFDRLSKAVFLEGHKI